MALTFSTDQTSVIDARDCNVLVSAAAGSGKTAVLTERIVKRVTDPHHPIDIDKILVVTFTNAAAREMKERIGARLNDEILKNPGDVHLQKQATLIHGAQITTIDSFCLYLVRNHFHTIDLDPAFRIAGEGEMKLLKTDVLKDLLKRAYASKDPDFYHVVDCYSKKDKDDSLEESIMKLFDYSMSYPWPEKWLNDHRKDYDFESYEAFEKSAFITSLKENVKERLKASFIKLDEAIKISLKPAGPYTYEETIKADKEQLENFLKTYDGKSFDELKAAFDAYEFVKMKNAPKGCDENLKSLCKGLRDSCKGEITKIKEAYFSFDLNTYFEDMKATGKVVNKLIDLVLDFIESFDKEKRARGIIDFSDMEHMAVKILVKEYRSPEDYDITEVAEGYRDYFEEVMVDEYQDSNLVQELIIQSVSREKSENAGNRFMVGDVKQSIYRFRLARPEIFTGKLNTYVNDSKALNRLITLKSNYRSRESVLSSVNAVFKDIMHESVGGVEYTADAWLYPGAEYSPDTSLNKSEVLLVKKEGKSEDARKVEADAIALKILEYVGSMQLYNVKEKTAYTASYKDIAVLFRSPTKWLDTLKDSFEKFGIPYHLEGVGAFYDTTEVREVISFLKVLNNPLDDIAFYAAMTSSFGRFTDAECARIKGIFTDRRFYADSVRAYSEANPEDVKVSGFLELLNKYRKLSRVLPIHELIERLFDETGYRHIVAAMPGGEQRLANVDMLITKATEYGKTSFYGLFHFLRYVELIKKIDEDEGEANTFDESSDVVRIMSIHKSKGLEFSICIMGGMDEDFNEMDLRANFVMDIDDGIGASFLDPDLRVKRNTLKKQALIDKCRKANIGEEIRVLYVGMTRAKEKLLMVGLDEDPDKWLSTEADTSDNSYFKLMHKSLFENMGGLFVSSVMSAEDIAAQNTKQAIDIKAREIALETGAKNPSGDLVKTLKERFSFEYPHKGLEKLYTKTTVSELKMAAIELQSEENEAFHPFEENDSHEYIPVFAGGELLVKGTDRGTAYHNLLQLIDFKKLTDTTDLSAEFDAQVKCMVSEEEMAREDVEKVFKGKILSFLKSDVCKRMAEADRHDNLYKEQPFVIGVPASSVDPEFPEEETLLVQGVIDAYFIEGDKVTVLDYKTDRVENKEELVKRYKKQLDYYGEAIRQLTGLNVKEKLIYSFALNETIVLP